MYREMFYGCYSCSEVKINLKVFIQEQKLLSKKETWAILQSFGYSSLINDLEILFAAMHGPHSLVRFDD